MLAKDHLDQPWPLSKTVDPKEVERFTRLADEWWNPSGKFRPVHAFNAVRLDYIKDRIARRYGRFIGTSDAFAGLNILDIGCGAGLLCEPLAELGAQVTGIDATARNVEIARQHGADRGLTIDYRHCLAEHVCETGDEFDVVLNTEVIENVADQGQFMEDCCRLVRPGGSMIVATLNRTARSFLLAIVDAEYVLRWLPKGTHDWRRFVQPNEIRTMIRRHGLETDDMHGVSYNPMARRWHVTSDTSVNYMLHATRTS